jgi:hypothetical protein
MHVIAQPAIAGPSGRGEPEAEISFPHQFMTTTPQESTRNSEELSTSNLIDSAAQHIGLSTNTILGSSRAAGTPPQPAPIPHPNSWSQRSASPCDLPVVNHPSPLSTPPLPYSHLETSPPTPPVDTWSQRSLSPDVFADHGPFTHHDREPTLRDSWSKPSNILLSSGPPFIPPPSTDSHSETTPFQSPLSPPVSARRKLRVPSSFNPFKSGSPPRPSPIQSSHVTTATSPTSSPANVPKGARSSRFFNSVKSTLSLRQASAPSTIPTTTSSELVIPSPPTPRASLVS